VLRCNFYFESLLGGEPNFPRHSKGGVVQIFFAPVKRLRELNKHALCESAVQVQAQGIAPRSVGHHATAAREQIVAREASQLVHLIGQQAFNAGGARHE
jgi:hypothetical protein